jgi:hypothetical protein
MLQPKPVPAHIVPRPHKAGEFWLLYNVATQASARSHRSTSAQTVLGQVPEASAAGMNASRTPPTYLASQPDKHPCWIVQKLASLPRKYPWRIAPDDVASLPHEHPCRIAPEASINSTQAIAPSSRVISTQAPIPTSRQFRSLLMAPPTPPSTSNMDGDGWCCTDSKKVKGSRQRLLALPAGIDRHRPDLLCS